MNPIIVLTFIQVRLCDVYVFCFQMPPTTYKFLITVIVELSETDTFLALNTNAKFQL